MEVKRIPFEDVIRMSFTEHGIEIREERNVAMGERKYAMIGYRK